MCRFDKISKLLRKTLFHDAEIGVERSSEGLAAIEDSQVVGLRAAPGQPKKLHIVFDRRSRHDFLINCAQTFLPPYRRNLVWKPGEQIRVFRGDDFEAFMPF